MRCAWKWSIASAACSARWRPTSPSHWVHWVESISAAAWCRIWATTLHNRPFAPASKAKGVSTPTCKRSRPTSSQRPTRLSSALPRFSPAEERVASLILAHPRAVMSEPISEIARRANVSQPTVIRFCRTMGCQGLADFKLKLASGVTGTVPVAHSQVHVGDSPLDVGVKVVDNTIAAMMEVRDSLNADTLSKVIEVLSHATRVEFYGFGSCGLVAEDAQQKFFRLGIPSTAYTDPQLQEVSASLLKNTDVAVIISNSGRLRHLATTVEVAVNSGATIIALAPSNSQLAKRADYTLAVEHDEGSTMHIPMVSRILMLLLVDVLAVGVSLNRSSPFAELQRQAKRGILAHIASPRDTLSDKMSAAGEHDGNDDGSKPNLISHTK